MRPDSVDVIVPLCGHRHALIELLGELVALELGPEESRAVDKGPDSDRSQRPR